MSLLVSYLKQRRALQAIKYGWKDALTVARKNGVSRWSVFKDMRRLYRKYNCWSNYYRDAGLWNYPEEKRIKIAEEQGKLFAARDRYVQYKYGERAFLAKYTSLKYETSPRLMKKRANAYRERYGIDRSVIMQYGLMLSTEHYTIGELKIGKNCLLGRNVDIDYTGGLELCDSVTLMDGVKILTHAHDSFNIYSDDQYLPFSNYAIPTPLRIGKNTSIGSRAIIMPGVEEIGENVMVSAGSVIKEKIPSNCIVAGNPAKVVAKIPKGLKRIYETKIDFNNRDEKTKILINASGLKDKANTKE